MRVSWSVVRSACCVFCASLTPGPSPNPGRGEQPRNIHHQVRSTQYAIRNTHHAPRPAYLARAGFIVLSSFSVSVLYAQEPDRAVAEIIVQQYRQLGLDASVRIWEWPVLQEATLKGERQMLLGSWGNSFRHPVDLLNPTLMTGGRGNYAHYSNAEIDQLLKDAAVASDDEAAEMYRRVQRTLYDEAPWVFLWVPNEIEAGSKALQGWEPGPDGRELLADTSLAT
ncbi:MAG: ABC transporter substrate-binding protein [Sphaerobacter sp.]|nr:ABC transporter substrate-binding protein [Sphaerobacter sp.]